MRFTEAKQTLPKFALGLLQQVNAVQDAHKVQQLRNAVKEELKDYRAGMNPLEPEQVELLYRWLARSGS